MTKDTVQLLTDPGNFAIVQITGRKFPGIVFQGDTLFSIISQVSEIQDMAAKYEDLELNGEIHDLIDLLNCIRRDYEKICLETNGKLPYVLPR